MKALLALFLLTSCSILRSQVTTPVLNDGSEVTFLEFTIPTKTEKTLNSIALNLTGTTDLKDIAEVKITHLRRAGDRHFASINSPSKTHSLTGPLELPKGKHKFKLTLRTKPNASLLNKISVQLTSYSFSDGTTIKLNLAAPNPQRLAFSIHKRGDHNCHTFRIPGIARAKNGQLLAVADMRYNSRRDLQGHMDIGLRTSKDGGQTWSPPQPIMDMGEHGGLPQDQNGCSDPCILVDDNTGEIFVAACWTHGKPNTHQWRGKGSEPGLDIHKTTQFMVVRSVDHGATWSKPENWTSKLKDPAWHLFAPAPGNGITLKNGTLVMPTQGRDGNGLPFSNITWSKDHGKTWHVSKPARDNTTECAVAELSDGSLLLNIRDNRNRTDKSETNGRAVSHTTDLGETWNVHSTDHAALPESVCMASLISDPSRKGTLYFSNPNNKNSRSHMTIRRSTDDGKTWSAQILLDTKGGAYSSLVMVDESNLGILYESSTADMVFQKIPLSEFDQPSKDPLVQSLFIDERFPNIVVSKKGTLIATWGNKHIRARRSTDGGTTWSPEITIANPGFQGGGTTVDETTGDILAFVEEGHPPAKISLYRSSDDGLTWTKEIPVIHPDSKGHHPSMHMNDHGITLRYGKHKGRLIRPSRYYAGKNAREKWPEHYTNAIYSDDHGKTWQTSEPFPENGTGEACIVELSDGSLYYNSRVHWQERPKNTRRREARSTDGGHTWKEFRIIDILPDGHQHRSYGCMGGLTRLPIEGEDILIFSNIDTPNATREQGTVWASFDGGKTWPVKRLILPGPSGYSALIAGRPGTSSEGFIYLHAESNNGSRIARFTLDWLKHGTPTGDGIIPTETK
ncbi:MAG: exo-alpha-sialidase [Akkermansiaceae bacterium]